MSGSVRRRYDNSREHSDVDRSDEEDRRRNSQDDDRNYQKLDGGDDWRDDSCSCSMADYDP